MKISVIWTWYVWLIQTVWLAKIGFKITALDIFEDKIEKLKSWIPTIYENWLEELLNETLPNIDFTTNINKLSWSDIIFLCVWTPQDDEWKTDLWYVYEAMNEIKPLLNWNEIVVVKSTVPIWTNKNIYKLLWEKISVVSNPEFLREWLAIEDFLKPDRIILWFKNDEKKEIKEKLYLLYNYFKNKDIQIIETDWQTAELIKYSANSFLATKISFINEIARLADSVWANIKDISKAIWMDSRIWEKFLNAWIWYWGSCFPKDVKSLIHQFKEYNLNWEIITKVDYINHTQTDYFIDKILKKYNNILHGKTIWVLWIAFKPETDDLRESKWLEIIKRLLYLWAKLKIYDYNKKALENFIRYYEWMMLSNSRWFFPISIWKDFTDICNNIDFLVINLEDKKILKEDFAKIQLKDNIIFDGRNILNKNEILKLGIDYIWVWY